MWPLKRSRQCIAQVPTRATTTTDDDDSTQALVPVQQQQLIAPLIVVSNLLINLQRQRLGPSDEQLQQPTEAIRQDLLKCRAPPGRGDLCRSHITRRLLSFVNHELYQGLVHVLVAELALIQQRQPETAPEFRDKRQSMLREYCASDLAARKRRWYVLRHRRANRGRADQEAVRRDWEAAERLFLRDRPELAQGCQAGERECVFWLDFLRQNPSGLCPRVAVENVYPLLSHRSRAAVHTNLVLVLSYVLRPHLVRYELAAHEYCLAANEALEAQGFLDCLWWRPQVLSLLKALLPNNIVRYCIAEY